MRIFVILRGKRHRKCRNLKNSLINQDMEYHEIGKTGMKVSALSFEHRRSERFSTTSTSPAPLKRCIRLSTVV